MPTPPSQSVFQLRIELQFIEPSIWRRLLVPGGIRLDKLHLIFQAAMGWTDSHLHSFDIGGSHYGMHFDDWDEDEVDEKTATVTGAIGGVKEFQYDYDFGDNWQHRVVVERRHATTLGLRFGVCLDGDNARPPEDVGGTSGYENFLEAISDASHEEHDQYLTWAGGSFDPTTFDIASVNVALQKIK